MVLAAFAATTVLMLLSPPVLALSDARRDAAACMLRMVDRQEHVTDPQRAAEDVLSCYRAAGIRVPVSIANPLLAQATVVNLGSSAALPSPGDLAIWKSRIGGDWSLGMVLDAADVIALDTASRHGYCVVPRAQMDNSTAYPELPQVRGACTNNAYAVDGTLEIVRLAPQLFPGGRDDPNPPPGSIALVDPQELATQDNWAALHPVEADRSPLHIFLFSLGEVLGQGQTAIGILGQALNTFANFVLQHKWLVPLLPIALAIKLFATKFDGRGLNHFLANLLIQVLGPLPLIFSAMGRLPVPILAGMAQKLAAAQQRLARFAVTLLTGLEPDQDSSLGTVLVSVATLPLLVLKPLLGLRAAAEGTHSLAIAADVGDALSLRPTTLESGLELVAPQTVRPWYPVLRPLARAGNLLSLRWRPQATGTELLRLSSDYLPKAVAKALAQLEPSRSAAVRHIIAEAQARAGPTLRGAAAQQHLRSGATVIADAFNGQGPPPAQLTGHRF